MELPSLWGHAGACQKSPNDTPWGALGLGLNRLFCTGQVTCVPLTLVKIHAGHLHNPECFFCITPDTSQAT